MVFAVKTKLALVFAACYLLAVVPIIAKGQMDAKHAEKMHHRLKRPTKNSSPRANVLLLDVVLKSEDERGIIHSQRSLPQFSKRKDLNHYQPKRTKQTKEAEMYEKS